MKKSIIKILTTGAIALSIISVNFGNVNAQTSGKVHWTLNDGGTAEQNNIQSNAVDLLQKAENDKTFDSYSLAYLEIEKISNKENREILSEALSNISSNLTYSNSTFTLDQEYANAYNAVVAALQLKGNINYTFPDSQRTISETKLAIVHARALINGLKGTGAEWAIGEFSKQVDQVQQTMSE